MKKYISEGLGKYLDGEHYPWHMPGHKRKLSQGDFNSFGDNNGIADMLCGIYRHDVTEVEGTDDLHHAEGMIKASLIELKRVYGSYASYYLVNGSTCGIMAAITACHSMGVDHDAKKGKIIVARNCHKSVFNTIDILGLEAVYAETARLGGDIYGSVNPDDIKRLCGANPDACAVVVTSPTYEGIMSDICAVSAVTHSFGIPLIVDEAHGAHLPFMRELGASAIYEGADIVIQSLHKTLPSMTQTAVIHVMNEGLNPAVKKYLSVYMSSSPSYPMLCSMEYAVSWAEEVGHDEYIHNLISFRKWAHALRHMRLLDNKGIYGDYIYAYDPTRIVLFAEDNISGRGLFSLLDSVGNIVCEMSGQSHVVLISSMCDGEEDFIRLKETLQNIDDNWDYYVAEQTACGGKCTEDAGKLYAEIDELLGQCAEEDIYIYPPEIPIAVKGEIITEEQIGRLRRYAAEGRRIFGCELLTKSKQ